MMLVLIQFLRQRVKSKPRGAFDLPAFGMGLTVRAAAEDDLQMAGLFNRAHEGDFCALKLQSDLFAQFATERINRLFSLFHEAARNAPAAARAKDVFE